MHPDRRPLAWALARYTLMFALLVPPWPGLGRTFVACVGAVATSLAGPVFSATNVTVVVRTPVERENLPEWRGVIEATVDLPEGPVRHAGAIDLRRAGWLQLATFFCLASAWPPVGSRRRLLAAVASSTVVATCIFLPVADFLISSGTVEAGAWVGTTIALLRRALIGAPGMAYALPGLTWVALARPGAARRIGASQLGGG